MNIRVGQGFDVHKFGGAGPLILGGVQIPHSSGVEAHSDGDVLVHAICDAILGASAQGDLGTHFPDTDLSYQGMDSRCILRDIIDKIIILGYSVVNIDATIIAQSPKILPYSLEMRVNIAHDCRVTDDMVNIKATTSEGLGFTGRAEGIVSMAVVLLSCNK
jgi:2-C-methyl-D-erythritol 2,4-cyclodiphosphate synthase